MDLVRMKGKDAVCDSLDVAEHFGKRNKNMIQNIERLAENSADVSALLRSRHTQIHVDVNRKNTT